MRSYETMFIVVPVLTDKQVNEFMNSVVEYIETNVGVIVEKTVLGLKKLAYPIQHKNTGLYVYFEFQLEPNFVDGLKVLFNRSENIVMRFLIYALDKHTVEFNANKRKALSEGSKENNKVINGNKNVGCSKVNGAQKMYCRFKRYDLKCVDYKNVDFLIKFLNQQGKLLPRRSTGNSLKWQKRVASAVKRARQLALLPYVTDGLK
jgi:small subunit ribosomal protein S18